MTDAVHIRRAGPADAGAVRGLVRAAYAKWVPVMGREPAPMLADYDLAVRNHEVDMVYQGATLVAVLELILHPDHLFIENVAVDPGHQGHGLGQMLMARAEARARQLHLPELRLLTAKAMAVNIALYQSLGFGIDREEPYKGGFTVYMSRVLQAAAGA